jgi:hypothetical protein
MISGDTSKTAPRPIGPLRGWESVSSAAARRR